MGFEEVKKKLNLDETLEKVKEVVRETVDQIDDAIDKGRETLSEKLDQDRGTETTDTAEGSAPQPTPGTEATKEPKPEYDI